MADMVRDLAVEQRKRLVARLLGFAERELYPHLPAEQQQALRREVLDAVGVYHDFLLDVLKVSRDGFVQNAEAVELIRKVHQSQVRLERGARATNGS